MKIGDTFEYKAHASARPAMMRVIRFEKSGSQLHGEPIRKVVAVCDVAGDRMKKGATVHFDEEEL